jgi:hypothetical protein
MTNIKKEKTIKKIMKKNPMCNPHPFSPSVIYRLEELLGSDYEKKIYQIVIVDKSIGYFDLENGDRCIVVPFNFIGKKLLFVERIIGVGMTITKKTEDGKVIGESELNDDLFYPFIYPNDLPLNISVNKIKRNKHIKSLGLPKEIETDCIFKKTLGEKTIGDLTIGEVQ